MTDFKRNIALTATVLSLAVMALPAEAANRYKIANGQAAVIDEHRVCQVVTNKVGRAVNIPTRSSSEWTKGTRAFLAENRKGMVVTPCSKPDVFTSCPTPTQSTPYGRRNTIVVVMQTRAEYRQKPDLSNAVRDGVNDMVAEIKRCGGNVTFSYVEAWGQIPSQGYDGGNRDSIEPEKWYAARNVPINSFGKLKSESSGPYRSQYWFNHALRESTGYMRSLIRSSPKNNRYVFVMAGMPGLSEGQHYYDLAKDRYRDMVNESKAQDNDVEVVYAGWTSSGIRQNLPLANSRAISIQSNDIDDALWAVGRNISMYAQGMAPNMAFNVAQRAVFPQ
jgi:hypothetical protein